MTNRYTITVTAPATVSTQIEVIAQSADRANELALSRARHPDARWELDDADYTSDLYLPDPDAAENEAEAVVRPITPIGDVLVVTRGSEKALYLRTRDDYVLINSITSTETPEDLEIEAGELARSLGTEVRNIGTPDGMEDWEWFHITHWMNRHKEEVLVRAYQAFRKRHGLPDYALDQILSKIDNPQIQAWASHLQDRWESDTGQVMP